MFRNLFGNLPPVSKNILIINVLFFLAKFVFRSKGIYLEDYLAIHYVASPLFQPYQFVTSIFMHSDIMHILFNMLGVVLMGSHLERLWGPKRYLLFYFVTGIGASLCSNFVNGIEVYQLTGTFFPDADVNVMINTIHPNGGFEYMREIIDPGSLNLSQLDILCGIYVVPELGASGALYGVLMAFALLFPNTEFMLMFPPIPIKAKWLALILAGVALYSGISGSMGGYAHFAHLGGMLFGFIMITIWRRDKSNFY